MPRIKPLTAGDALNRQLEGIISKHMIVCGYDNTDAAWAKALNVSPSTAGRRRKDLSQMQLNEIRHLVKLLNIPIDEIVMGLLGKGVTKC